MINCIIVDDEEMSRKTIEQLISKAANWKLVAICANILEARAALQKNKVDVIFLDVEMPEVSGIDFLRMAAETPEVVMVTSKEKYAVDAFTYGVTDFILKPATMDRFLKTVDRIEERLKPSPDNFTSDDSMFVKVNEQLVPVKLSEVQWIEAYGDYVNIFTEKDRFVVHSTMKGIESRLPTQQFMRVHRSFIVRLDKINAIEDTLILIGKKLIPIGESYRNELLLRIKPL